MTSTGAVRLLFLLLRNLEKGHGDPPSHVINMQGQFGKVPKARTLKIRFYSEYTFTFEYTLLFSCILIGAVNINALIHAINPNSLTHF